MGRKLANTVYVNSPETGESVQLLAGTEPPGWAVPLITNDAAWAKDEVDLDDMTKDELLEEAERRGVEAHKSWTKDEIVEAIKAGPEAEGQS